MISTENERLIGLLRDKDRELDNLRLRSSSNIDIENRLNVTL